MVVGVHYPFDYPHSGKPFIIYIFISKSITGHNRTEPVWLTWFTNGDTHIGFSICHTMQLLVDYGVER
jgi:hypothetical protein